MQTNLFESLSRASVQEVLSGARRAVGRESCATAELVAYLAEVDRRELHLLQGYPTLCEFCVQFLGLSEGEAWNRIEVAKTVRRFPRALDLLQAGELNLWAIRRLGPHLTPENHEAVLDEARGARKAALEQIVVRLAPKPSAPVLLEPIARRAPAGDGPPAAPHVPSAPSPHGVPPTPVAPDRFRLQVTITGSTAEKLRKAQDLLAHALPGGDPAVVLERALDALIADLERRKAGAGRAPSSSPGSRSRHVPAAVRAAVWQRDGGRCAFVGSGGHRCGSQRFVEFHHRHPFALGGTASVDNIQLRCRAHNQFEGRADFGRRPVPQQTASP